MYRAIEKAIAPYYAYVRPPYLSRLGVSTGGDLELKQDGPPELPKEVFEMLLCIGPYLYRNALLLQKVPKWEICYVSERFILSFFLYYW